MKLWIESAQQSQGGPTGGTPGSLISTLTTEEGFAGLVMSGTLGPAVGSRVRSMVGRPWSSSDVDDLLSALPSDEHAPLAILQVGDDARASLLECDAPPLFMARRGRLVLLPVVEEEVMGRLVRTCEFDLRDGDHLAMVSEGYLQGIGAGKPSPYVGWREVAVAVRRLTETRCDAEQLAGALIRQYQRLAGDEAGSRKPGAGSSMGVQSAIPNGHAVRNPQSAIAVLAMFVRPMRTVTIWTGPPADRAIEKHVLDTLMREEDMRVVCGDTTAEIGARMLGAELVMEPPPPEGWAEVPPVSRMILPDGAEAVTMVTEGVVTMRVARERLAGVARARDLVGRADGASRLAHLFLTADRVRFLVGSAVNPAQVSEDGTPLRWVEVRDLVDDLKARGKIVSLERF
jgi:hypothetical protein